MQHNSDLFGIHSDRNVQRLLLPRFQRGIFQEINYADKREMQR